jgi:multidrug transporter EmrE-like cation transporter
MEQQAIKHRKVLKKHGKKFILTWIAIVGLFMVFGALTFFFFSMNRATTNLSGAYVAQVGYGAELLSLHPAGTFQQTVSLTSGKVFNTSGTWEVFEGRVLLHGAFLYNAKTRPNMHPPSRGSWSLPIRSAWGIRLIINEDEKWFFSKVNQRSPLLINHKSENDTSLPLP